jgi:2,4-dienoyl-CoA reductase-like NADH-dependent reductase (Old Yellow Enzyme family)/thioredoxin reductase
MGKKFEKLFEPIQIGKVTVTNRIYMPSMCTNYAGPHGESTLQDIGYYEARARGGAGLITVDYACISPEGRGTMGQRGLWKNEFMPHFKRVVDAIKVRGARVTTQLHHAGVIADVAQPMGPSRLSNRQFFVTEPREFSTEEVEQLVDKFADAAVRAQNCGVDMVEVHGTHGYLVCQFISPLYNMRTDKYGRDRPLFAVEVVQRIKEKCGDDFPVSFRLNADELSPGGITLDYAKEVAKRLEASGVDLLNVTGTNADTEDYCEPNMYLEDEEKGEYYRFIRLGSEIKKVVSIPVASGGLLTDPVIAERLLQEGALDMVFIGRQLIADPDWPNKVRTGRLEDIRPCTACNDGCIGRLFLSQTVWCTVNALSGFEYRWLNDDALPRPAKRKKVLIVGAGPGGLEAARICALRGQKVSVVDGADKIGGVVNIASLPSFKKRWGKLIEWYDTQLKKLGVKIRLKTKATVGLVKKEAPDALVLATGSRPIIPDIPGIARAITVDDVLLSKKKIGRNVVIIGGGSGGLDTALYLAKQGKKVTIVEAMSEVGVEMETTTQMSFFRKPGGLIDKYKITMMTKSPVVEVKDNGVVVVDAFGCRRVVEGDTVICAVGRESVLDSELMQGMEEAYVIGDAREPRKIIDAIHEGFTAALDM